MAGEGGEKKKTRQHRATWARDNKKGGWIIRVAGPLCNMFADRDVPVTMKNGGEETVKLARLIWTGKDNETGEPVSLYEPVPKPRDATEAEF